MAKTAAKQFAKDFEAKCAPYQFGLATPAGADCVAALLRAESDRDPNRVFLAIDGIGAYNHCKRKAMLLFFFARKKRITDEIKVHTYA